MNVYLLPGTGVFGGIKVGFQFCDLLRELGRPCVVATPGGMAPEWFRSETAVIERSTALADVSSLDTVIFSLPHDNADLSTTPARKLFHCQGTDPLIDPVLADHGVSILTCWPQAESYARSAGRAPIDVGIGLSETFFYGGEAKLATQVAYMPRRGSETARACAARAPGLQFVPISGRTESGVAEIMKRSAFFLATAEDEWFGLPALEAMAAGCVVLSVPVLGGMDYLEDGMNCRIASPTALPDALIALASETSADLRVRIRDGARATAARYRPRQHLQRVRKALTGELGALLS